MHLQSKLPIKFEHNSARSYIFCFDGHPTYDMDSDEEEKKFDHIIKPFCEPYETKVDRTIPFVEGILIEDDKSCHIGRTNKYLGKQEDFCKHIID